MTTILGNEDPFEEVERGIDWLERLENIRERDRTGMRRFWQTVEYVNRLREAIAALSDDANLERIAELHGQEIADLIRDIRDGGSDDPWIQYLRPTLLEQ